MTWLGTVAGDFVHINHAGTRSNEKRPGGEFKAPQLGLALVRFTLWQTWKLKITILTEKTSDFQNYLYIIGGFLLPGGSLPECTRWKGPILTATADSKRAQYTSVHWERLVP